MSHRLPPPRNGSTMGTLITLDSILNPIPLEGLFPTAQPLEIEVGAGDGGFLAAWAAAQSKHNFIGVERLLGRLRRSSTARRPAGL